MKTFKVNLEKIVDFIVCVLIVALVILMFTGKVGAIISFTVFSALIVIANVHKRRPD